MAQWQERLGTDNLLKKYKVRQFIKIIRSAEPITEYDVELYFALAEKITVFYGGRVVIVLLDGSNLEC